MRRRPANVSAALRWGCGLMGVLLVCGLTSPGLADQALTVGVSLGLSGPFAPIAAAQYKGFKLWEDNVNAAGGIMGRRVAMIIEDDHSDPIRAAAIYRELITARGADFLFAPYSSLITEAVLPIAEGARIPILIAGAAADRLWAQGYHHAVGVYTPASKFTLGFLELLVQHRLDRITIVYADDSFSVDLAHHAHKWIRRFGLTLVAMQSFAKGQSDLAPLARTARDNRSDVLMVCGHMNEAVNMTQALKQIGWRPKAFYASVGPALQAFYDRCGPDAELVFATSLWEPAANYPGAQDFNRQFTDTYGSPPGYHAGLAYAAGQVLEKAVVEARSTDRALVRDALFRLDAMTIIGRFGVDKTGKQVRQHTFIIQWQNGRKALVWPGQIQTAEPRFP